MTLDDETVYEHPNHAKMEWYEFEDSRVSKEGWRCTRCNVMATPDRADDVFDSHDCDHYKELRQEITGGLI